MAARSDLELCTKPFTAAVTTVAAAFPAERGSELSAEPPQDATGVHAVKQRNVVTRLPPRQSYSYLRPVLRRWTTSPGTWAGGAVGALLLLPCGCAASIALAATSAEFEGPALDLIFGSTLRTSMRVSQPQRLLFCGTFASVNELELVESGSLDRVAEFNLEGGRRLANLFHDVHVP